MCRMRLTLNWQDFRLLFGMPVARAADSIGLRALRRAYLRTIVDEGERKREETVLLSRSLLFVTTDLICSLFCSGVSFIRFGKQFRNYLCGSKRSGYVYMSPTP